MADPRWQATDLNDAEIDDAVGFHLTPEEIVAWAPFPPLEIHWARRHGLSLDDARLWARNGVPIRDAVKARAVGLTLEELHEWERAGFNASDAWEARETGLTIAEAEAWRDAGFVIPDALQLVRDHWTLAAAAVARVRHLRPG
jgi:hypothetical protein